VPLTLGFGLGAALLLNSVLIRFKTFFRMGFYLPVVTSIVAIAVIWRYLLHPDLGLINNLLAAVGIDGPNWLADPILAMPAIIAMAVWRNVGFVLVIFLAGLQGIPQDLSEAARIDGASRWKEFRYITLPMLRPTLLFASVITGIGYLQLFEEPFVMTGGGPLDRTLSVTMYVYQQGFSFLNLGYASAIAYALFMAIVILTVINFRLLRPQT
jgi:multiple sugar transport system permease protein